METELARGFPTIFMIHQMIVFTINAFFLLAACQYQTKSYTRKEINDNRGCTERINPFFGLGLTVECAYAITTTIKLVIKNRLYAFEHLDEIDDILEFCTDTSYVSLDIGSLKADFRATYIMRKGSTLIFIYIAQVAVLAFYMVCFARLTNEQMDHGNRLYRDELPADERADVPVIENPEANLPQSCVPDIEIEMVAATPLEDAIVEPPPRAENNDF